MPEEKVGRAPELSKRRKIIVIADEAHRSQYNLIDGLACNLRDSLPNASLPPPRLDVSAALILKCAIALVVIGLTPSLPISVGLRPAVRVVHVVGAHLPPFTGTPIEKTDANTRAIFGDLPSQALRECRP